MSKIYVSISLEKKFMVSVYVDKMGYTHYPRCYQKKVKLVSFARPFYSIEHV